MKNFLKELMITILLCIALVLILAVIFYDYIPINKTIPQPVEYTMPESLSEVKEELNSAVQNEEARIIVTYEIDDSDLSGYKKQGSYKEGKVDPFSMSNSGGNTTTNSTSKNTSSTSTSSSSTSTKNNNVSNTINNSNTTNTKEEQENPNSTGTFFDDGGMK